MVLDLKLTERGQARFWSKVALPDENGCMLWLGSPSSDGYGRMQVGPGRPKAHRISLWLAAGDPPSTDSEAAHSCRQTLCVAPAHLRWATRVENDHDKHRDQTDSRGERNANAKLTAQQVAEIRAKRSAGATGAELALAYGITRNHVYWLANGRSWKHQTKEAM